MVGWPVTPGVEGLLLIVGLLLLSLLAGRC